MDGNRDEPSSPSGARVQRLLDALVARVPADGAFANVTLDAAGINSQPGESGSLLLAGATTELAARIDSLQWATGEGPTIDTVRDGTPTVARLLDHHTQRWPAFVESAQRAGVGAVVAVPLRIGAIRLGAVTLYRLQPRSFTDADVATALTGAEAVAYAVLDDTAQLVGTTLPDDTRPAGADTLSGLQVHQATGMLMVQLGVPIEVAAARLRAYAWREGRDIRDVARDVVSRRLRLEDDGTGGDAGTTPRGGART